MDTPQKLENLSTHSQEIKWLGKPEHENYQQCWTNFYQRYHTPILNYILKKANWRQDRIVDAEEIASLVYEKGFRWNFKKETSIRFRVLLKRLVKDVFSDYMRKNSKSKVVYCEKYHEVAVHSSMADDLSIEILQLAAERTLHKYQGRHRAILDWVWSNSRWPKAEEMIVIFEITGADMQKNKQAVRQWHKRNRGLWDDFQNRLRHELSALAIGEETQAEVEHFENLETT